MTPFNKVYTAFLSRILEDEWAQWMYEEAEQDWRQLLENAITWFKFPREFRLNMTKMVLLII